MADYSDALSTPHIDLPKAKGAGESDVSLSGIKAILENLSAKVSDLARSVADLKQQPANGIRQLSDINKPSDIHPPESILQVPKIAPPTIADIPRPKTIAPTIGDIPGSETQRGKTTVRRARTGPSSPEVFAFTGETTSVSKSRKDLPPTLPHIDNKDNTTADSQSLLRNLNDKISEVLNAVRDIQKNGLVMRLG